MRISDWSSDVCSSDLAVLLRALGEIEYPRGQFGQDPFALGVLVARVQRGELDRDRRRRNLVLEGVVAPDRGDCVVVGPQVAVGIVPGQRGLAEHVERIAVGGVVALAPAQIGRASGRGGGGQYG